MQGFPSGPESALAAECGESLGENPACGAYSIRIHAPPQERRVLVVEEKVVHWFSGGPDGSVPDAASPSGPLIYFNGNFYGVSQSGCGTVFSLAP
jgi:hypothetical protein